VFRSLKALLPRTPLWDITNAKPLRYLFEAIGTSFDPVRTYFDLLWLDAFPSYTRQMNAWDAVQGVKRTGFTDAEKITRMAGWLQMQGGQSPRYIQDVLQASGYPVYVHDWWSDTVPTARNPRTTLVGIQLGCDDLEMECGEPLAECGAFKSATGYALVNKLYIARPAYVTGCDETLMECGEATAECGNYDGLEFYRIEYEVPEDPTLWPYFMYVGGATFGDQVFIPLEKKEDFEDLLLSICPEHLWLGLLVTYVSGYIYEDASLEYLYEDALGTGTRLYEVQ